MMATTHVFVGISAATVVAALTPEFAPIVVAAAIVGGFVPDLDLLAGHRKTLHFPVYYSLCALVTGALALVGPTVVMVAVAIFFLTAAAHSLMDILGSGLELRPWLGTSQRAVYDHYHGRWIPPRQWVRYDGAPEDFLLGAALAIPGMVAFDGTVRNAILALLAISLVYTIVRKPMVRVAERFVDRAPAEIVDRVPEQFLPVEEDRSDRPSSN